jgi:NAD(P)-dependent dehydrogenase (short-subunit alcohol dehydrogenase family)
MSLSFKGHVVVVTGAGGGLGKASVFPLLALQIVGRMLYHPQVLSAI